MMQKKVCMIMGNPVDHSLSPLIHNVGYKALGIDGEYEYLSKRVRPQEIEKFIREVRKKQILGVSCTVPNKEAVIPFLEEIDETAQKIGAVNTITNQNGTLKGHNTDWIGAVKAISTVTEIKSKKIAIIGAGGTSKALIFGLLRSGAHVIIYNRSIIKAKSLAVQFACEFRSLSEMSDLSDIDVICNATPVGMNNPNLSPVPKDLILDKHIVFDAVYSPYTTKLLNDAKQKGATIVHGTEMLLEQAYAQFKLFTGVDAPKKAMKAALMDKLSEK